MTEATVNSLIIAVPMFILGVANLFKLHTIHVQWNSKLDALIASREQVAKMIGREEGTQLEQNRIRENFKELGG
jgi:hypothetical protein